MKQRKSCLSLAAGFIFAAFSSTAAAAPAVFDVSLNGQAANAFGIFEGNAQGGKNGNADLFSSAFGTGWTLLTKVGSGGQISDSLGTLAGSSLAYSFNLAGDKESGTWAVTSSSGVKLDLAFAMHAGGSTGAFLFDDITLNQGSNPGTFRINWTNNGGQTPAYSNLTLFARDAVAVSPVPEPETYLMMLVGLGAVGFLARRKAGVGNGSMPAAA